MIKLLHEIAGSQWKQAVPGFKMIKNTNSGPTFRVIPQVILLQPLCFETPWVQRPRMNPAFHRTLFPAEIPAIPSFLLSLSGQGALCSPQPAQPYVTALRV